MAMNVTMPARGTRVRWLVILGAWLAYWVMMVYQTYFAYAQEGKAIPFSSIFLPASAYCVTWLLLTPLVLHLSRRYPLDRVSWKRNLSIHLAASLVIAFSQRFTTDVVVMALRASTQWPFSMDSVLARLIGYFDYGLLVYWIILLIDQALEYYRTVQSEHLKASQLETRLAEARLEALRSQLQPHFLFNTLNSVSALIHIKPEAADTMIARLGDFLRITLANSGSRVAPLSTELEALRSYFDIERVRFEDRVALEMDIDPRALDALIPSFVWQPLVENAIRHGIETSGGSGRITVRAHARNGSLVLQIQDSGPGLTGGNGRPAIREGIGLTNIRAILHHLYGSSHRFEMANAPGGGVLATLTIPFTTAANAQEAPDGKRDAPGGEDPGRSRR